LVDKFLGEVNCLKCDPVFFWGGGGAGRFAKRLFNWSFIWRVV